jgi:hypothetical protein
MILGDSSLIGGLDVGGSPAPAAPALLSASAGVQLSDATRVVDRKVPPGPALNWGLISVPTQPAPDGEAQGDPALWIYLQFLKAFLQTDRQVTALWAASGMAPGAVVVNAIRAHNPGDDQSSTPGLGLTTKDLPALYMWRKDEAGATTVEQIAEDWRIATSEVRLLWVFPEMANTGIQRTRATFVDALAKCIDTAIELGRTPSFVVPGDPDPLAATIGSFVHTFTEVYSLNTLQWGASRVRITTIGERGDASATVVKPALEMRFDLKENLVKDPNLWSFPAALQQTVTDGQPQATLWAPTAVFSTGAYLQATPAGGRASYIYQASGAGISGFGPPVWPITTGATVADGSITWTCLGPAGPPGSILGRA